eukprot:357058-Chlamydomonas_euryale.AAC.2
MRPIPVMGECEVWQGLALRGRASLQSSASTATANTHCCRGARCNNCIHTMHRFTTFDRLIKECCVNVDAPIELLSTSLERHEQLGVHVHGHTSVQQQWYIHATSRKHRCPCRGAAARGRLRQRRALACGHAVVPKHAVAAQGFVRFRASPRKERHTRQAPKRNNNSVEPRGAAAAAAAITATIVIGVAAAAGAAATAAGSRAGASAAASPGLVSRHAMRWKRRRTFQARM